MDWENKLYIFVLINLVFEHKTDFQWLSQSHHFELIFHKFFPKMNSFSSLVTKPLRKMFLEDIFQLLQAFGTNSDSK